MSHNSVELCSWDGTVIILTRLVCHVIFFLAILSSLKGYERVQSLALIDHFKVNNSITTYSSNHYFADFTLYLQSSETSEDHMHVPNSKFDEIISISKVYTSRSKSNESQQSEL